MRAIASALLLSFAAFLQLQSQVPQSFKYQTVVRDNSGNLVSNQAVSFQIGIMHDAVMWDMIYLETHTTETNDQGLATLEIGGGTASFGQLDAIDWSLGDYFLEIGIDLNGGSDYYLMGSSPLLSVPYSLYAEKAGNAYWQKNGVALNYLPGNVGIGVSSPDSKLHAEGPAGTAKLVTPLYALYGGHFSGSYGYLGGSNVGGFGYSSLLYGLWGSTNDGYAVYGSTSGSGYGGYFDGKGYFSGNLGIGVTNPALKLEVNGGSDIGLASGGYFLVGTPGAYNIGMDDNEIMARNNGAASILNINREGGNVLLNEFGGSVGIGKNNPTAKLDVNGTVKATAFAGDGSQLTGVGDDLGDHTATQNIALSGNWLSGDGGNEGVYVAADGNIGLGTDAPVDRVHVKSGGETFLGIERNEGYNGGISHYETGTEQAKWIMPYFRGWQSDNLIVREEIADIDVMTFQFGTGNVGINTPYSVPPSEKLHVEGNIYLSGSIRTAEKSASLSIAPAGFQCAYQNRSYVNHGSILFNDDILFDNEFNATVQLPDGAVLTSLTTYWIDNASSDASVSLRRTELLQGNTTNITNQLTYWNSASYNSMSTGISGTTIDNDNYYYFLRIELPNTYQVQFLGAKIEYTTTTIQ